MPHTSQNPFPTTQPSNGWTPERRAAQAARCRANKPWQKSTGPKTEGGKARSARNALKHGNRCREYNLIRYSLWLNREFLKIATLAIAASHFDFTNEVKEIRKKSNKINGTPHQPRDFYKRTEGRGKNMLIVIASDQRERSNPEQRAIDSGLLRWRCRLTKTKN